MSIIVGIQHPVTKEIAIAADGMGSSDYCVVSFAERKIFKIGRFTLGLAGESLTFGVLRQNMESLAGARTLDEFADLFFFALIERYGVEPKISGNSARKLEFCGVISDGLQIAQLCSTGSSSVVEPGFPVTVGCGYETATGAAIAYMRLCREPGQWTPLEVTRFAVEVTCGLIQGCGGQVIAEIAS